ncbi:MAG TPA: cupin domain-containing protein [Solirubrobacteraceae bacterium]|jgi:uncharacterized cupin superfamily protein|nr:cupin domain-containing protein [Solirubrobacteraceae bacterium]
MGVANFNEGRSNEVERGHLQGVWRDLGRQAGTRAVGLRRIEIAPGCFSTPAHEHGAEEEIFFVLAGEGLLWQSGETFAVGAGDCIVHLPGRGAHTLRAGEQGLDVLVFGQRLDAALTALPRAGVAWSGRRWVALGDGAAPFEREARCGPPECPEPSAERPANVVSLAGVEPVLGGRARLLARAAGSVASGLNHVVLAAGEQGAPAHCHSAEEEIFVVLEGDGVLELWGREATQPEEQPLRVGDVVSRVPGTGVAHALRPGAGGIAYLAYGTREPSDMCFYPRSGRVSLRGLGIALRAPEIEHLPQL